MDASHQDTTKPRLRAATYARLSETYDAAESVPTQPANADRHAARRGGEPTGDGRQRPASTRAASQHSWHGSGGSVALASGYAGIGGESQSGRGQRGTRWAHGPPSTTGTSTGTS